MKRSARAAAFVASAIMLAPATGWSGRNGYSVEAAAGISSDGPALAPTADAHPYHPFRDFGQAPAAAPVAAPSSYRYAGGGSDESHPERAGGDATAGPAKPAAPAPEEEKPAEFTAADARANFPAVVETFFRKEGENGVWTLKESGRARRFALVSAEAKRLKSRGGGVYSGPVLLRDAATRKPLVAEFTVDFSGPEWKVVSAKVAPPPPAAQR